MYTTMLNKIASHMLVLTLLYIDSQFRKDNQIIVVLQ